MEIINIRWGTNSYLTCGPSIDEDVVEVAYGDNKDIVYVLMAQLADNFRILVTTHSVYDIDRYTIENQDIEGVLADKIKKVTLEDHDIMLECDEEEEEVFAKIDSKYKELILKTYKIMSDLECEGGEDAIEEIIEKYNQM